MWPGVDAIARARVLVLGDVMLDRYWFGDVARVSPEAPVPVVKVSRTDDRLGGAANVARNVAALGAAATLLSVVGDDDAGREVSRLAVAAGIGASLHIDSRIKTTVKLRVLGRQQQLLRIDFEEAPSHEVLDSKLQEFENIVSDFDAVILSDYGKGGLNHIARIIQIARAAGKPVLVDPKGDDYGKYTNATIVTPNKSELQQVVGRWSSESELAEKAKRLGKALGLEAVLVTRSEEGMTLFTEGDTLHQAALAREVFDVSGAGDTVIATLGVMIAVGASWSEAIRAANIAAGIVVGKIGTAVVTGDEISAAIEYAETHMQPCHESRY